MFFDLIFYFSWILLLVGIFIFSREMIVAKLTKHENLAIFGAFLVTVSLMFEAILMLEEHKWRDDTLVNKFQRWAFGLQPSDHWKWHVNPITVPFSLLGRILVLFASIFGESAGKFVGNYFSALPATTALLTAPFTFWCIAIAIFCIFGYQFDFAHGFLKIEAATGTSRIPAIFRRRRIGEANPPSRREEHLVTILDKCVKKVNEGYQKAKALGRN